MKILKEKYANFPDKYQTVVNAVEGQALEDTSEFDKRKKRTQLEINKNANLPVDGAPNAIKPKKATVPDPLAETLLKHKFNKLNEDINADNAARIVQETIAHDFGVEVETATYKDADDAKCVVVEFIASKADCKKMPYDELKDSLYKRFGDDINISCKQFSSPNLKNKGIEYKLKLFILKEKKDKSKIYAESIDDAFTKKYARKGQKFVNEDLIIQPIVEVENNTLGCVADSANKVMEAYQNANKWLDIIKEYLFSDLGCPFFASYIHNLAHTMPVRFDKFGDILHTIDMKIPYPATQYIPSEPQNIDDVFNLVFMILDAIKSNLNDFIKCTDDNYHGMSCAAESLLNDIEAEYTPLYKMRKAWTEYKEPMRFDRWVGTYAEKRSDLNESFKTKYNNQRQHMKTESLNKTNTNKSDFIKKYTVPSSGLPEIDLGYDYHEPIEHSYDARFDFDKKCISIFVFERDVDESKNFDGPEFYKNVYSFEDFEALCFDLDINTYPRTDKIENAVRDFFTLVNNTNESFKTKYNNQRQNMKVIKENINKRNSRKFIKESLNEYREDNGYKQHVWIILDPEDDAGYKKVIKCLGKPQGEGDFNDNEYKLDYIFDSLDEAENFISRIPRGYKYDIEELDESLNEYTEANKLDLLSKVFGKKLTQKQIDFIKDRWYGFYHNPEKYKDLVKYIMDDINDLQGLTEGRRAKSEKYSGYEWKTIGDKLVYSNDSSIYGVITPDGDRFYCEIFDDEVNPDESMKFREVNAKRVRGGKTLTNDQLLDNAKTWVVARVMDENKFKEIKPRVSLYTKVYNELSNQEDHGLEFSMRELNAPNSARYNNKWDEDDKLDILADVDKIVVRGSTPEYLDFAEKVARHYGIEPIRQEHQWSRDPNRKYQIVIPFTEDQLPTDKEEEIFSTNYRDTKKSDSED